MNASHFLAIVFAAALAAGGPARGQSGDRPAGPADADAPRPSAPPGRAVPTPPRPAPPLGLPAPGGATDTLPGVGGIRAQFNTSMRTVDMGLSALDPSLGRTVRDLKRFAFVRVPSDPERLREHRRLLDARVRDLIGDQQRLASLERILGRWRSGAVATPETNMMLVSGVQRRALQISMHRRQIECGHHFARTAGRAIATRGAVRPTVPAGC